MWNVILIHVTVIDSSSVRLDDVIHTCQLFEIIEQHLQSSYISYHFQNVKEEKANVKSESKSNEGQNKIRFEFYDPGNHWCRNCNLICGNIYEVLIHLQSKKHQQVGMSGPDGLTSIRKFQHLCSNHSNEVCSLRMLFKSSYHSVETEVASGKLQ